MSRTIHHPALVTAALLAATLLTPAQMLAHCDTLDGPVVRDAHAALAAGDVAPTLKWVRAADEAELRLAFTRAAAVRPLGGEARDLADTFFLDTLVRLHRASEGMPYTGLRPSGTPLEPGVALADRSLVDGNVDAVVAAVTAQVTREVRERFARVSEAKAHASHTTQAGRSWVAAYVAYVHYVEAQLAGGGAGHNHESAAPAHAHNH